MHNLPAKDKHAIDHLPQHAHDIAALKVAIEVIRVLRRPPLGLGMLWIAPKHFREKGIGQELFDQTPAPAKSLQDDALIHSADFR